VCSSQDQKEKSQKQNRKAKQMSNSKKLKVIISGGGTGGHVFPAIAIANALKKRDEQMDILFVGAKDRMEMEKVPAAGYPIEGLWISGLQRRLTLKNLSFPFKLISSLWKVRKIVKNFQPHIAIGVGGYASGPTLQIATKKKIPTLIQEQNSFPGITNRLLANKVDRICVAYDGMEKYFPAKKIIKTGNPVRANILNISNDPKEARKYFKLENDKPTLLVIGGSLGAKTINESLGQGAMQLSESGIQVIWQTGKFYYEESKKLATPFEKMVKAHDFITRMDHAYAAADVIISRAGAS
jgi:UDP-N-acetylglucosamine--N-acetylmuramyl-(pentapeptide) pyrophosphoryl-undecaprenol N-acetylglucosamine transferase